MGLGDNRRSPKMRRKKAQTALKARLKRKRATSKAPAEKPAKAATTTKKK